MKLCECYVCRLVHGPPFRTGEEMQFEEIRLASFVNWPESATKRPTELAKDGFYYFGRRKMVKCFACAGEIDVYKLKAEVAEEHQRRFPRCDFVRGRAYNTIESRAFACLASRSGRRATDEMEGEQGSQQSSARPGASGQTTASQEDRDGRSSSAETGSISVGETASSSPDESVQAKSKEPKKRYLPEQNRTVLKPKFGKYATEFSRLQSFAHWPKSSIINPTALAKAGFFYLGYSDDVKCFFCGNGIRAWSSGCDPLMLHAQWYPSCEFLKQVMNERKIEQNEVCGDDLATSYNQSVEKRDMKKKSNLDSSTMKPVDKEDEEVKQLKKEYKRLKRMRTCKKCRNAFANITFLPCGHIMYCSNCVSSEQLNCSYCKKAIKGAITVRFP